jgi:hypothetical protein
MFLSSRTAQAEYLFSATKLPAGRSKNERPGDHLRLIFPSNEFQ